MNARNGTLAYGMQLPVQSQSSIYAEPWELVAGREAIAAIARKADATGFDYVAVCDHVAVPREAAETMRTTWYDTVATLGWLAGITERVRLLSHVYVVAHRHPLATAKAFMTLDELSDGRAILGVGAGHLQGEFALLGTDFDRRGKATDAAIETIRRAFADEDVDGAGLAPRPRQASIPIWIGGSSKAALRRVAALGDGWLPQGTPKREMAAAIASIREHAPRPVAIGGSPRRLYVGTSSWELGPYDLSGEPARIAEYLRGFADIGVDHVQIRFRSRSLDEYLDQMDAFASEVAPSL